MVARNMYRRGINILNRIVHPVGIYLQDRGKGFDKIPYVNFKMEEDKGKKSY